MKKSSAVLLFFLCNAAHADWLAMGKTENGNEYFLDPSTKVLRTRPRVWMLVNFPRPDENKVRSTRTLYEADCAEGRLRFLSKSVHSRIDAGGKTIAGTNNPGEWLYPPPETPAEMVFAYLCPKNP